MPKVMDDMRRAAKAYHDSGSREERRLYDEFFESMHPDKHGQVGLDDFLEFMSEEGHQNMSSRHFFKELDRDRSGGLDYHEVLTLYYIIKSGRPCCGRCRGFIAGLYFTCVTCFNHSTCPFSVCLDCYGHGRNLGHEHPRDNFLDNYALLEAKRKSALARTQQSQSGRPRNDVTSQAIVTRSSSRVYREQAASTSLAIVPADRRRRRWRTAFKAFETGLQIASLVSNCTIM